MFIAYTKVTSAGRNAWRDMWIRRSYNAGWTRAAVWREHSRAPRQYPYTERRLYARRIAD